MKNNISFKLAMQANYEEKHKDVPKCQESDCNDPAIQCTIPPGYNIDEKEYFDETYEYYCHKHAAENGFCALCGTFIAGWIENDDLCENCRDEINYNEYDAGDEDDFYYSSDYLE